MRWLPRTLFGRLMLVLASGLVLAQLVGAAINYQERGSLLERSTGIRIAQRIGDVVRLLDSLSPEERRHIAAVLDVPPLVVKLDQPPADGAPSRAAAAPMFGAVLRSVLGSEHDMRIAMGEGRPLPPPPGMGPFGDMPMGMGAGPGRFGPGGGSWLLVHVKLHDGTWVAFDTRVPESSTGFPWRLAATLGVLLAAILVLSWIAVRFVTRPLKVLSSAAEELGRDLHRPPLPETGPAEVAGAARAFNAMQRRLVDTLEERSRILAAMSHDLKTPITRMRLRADLLDDAAVQAKMEEDLREMDAMITQALEFMRGTGGHEAKSAVDVAALLERIRSDNEAMGRKVTVGGAATRPVMGTAGLLKRCIGNLVDNAVLYGGAAEVYLEQKPQALEVHVRDHGPGIPESQLDRVFEPFFRLEGSRSRETGGTGLGLGIARNIARAHGGDVRLRNAQGGGLEATLVLPG